MKWFLRALLPLVLLASMVWFLPAAPYSIDQSGPTLDRMAVQSVG
jgi:hypothetical protein